MLEPITRIEHFLSAVSGSGECPSPITRVEYFLGSSAGVCECPEPITRLEMFLAAAAGNGEAPEPITRLEFFLGAVSGKCEAPEPITRIEYFLKDWAEGGGSYITKVIEGNAPLTFTAVAAALVSLTQYGNCTQASTPTPSVPVDIVCNNGALRMVHRSGLPSGYKLLEYVGSSGAAYVVTDVFLASTDVVEAEFRNNSTSGYGSLYGVFKLGDSSALYANQTYYGYDESNNKVDTDLRVNTDWHSTRHDFVNGTLTIDDTTVTFTPFEFANSVQNAVLSRYYNNNYGYVWKGFVRKFKVTRGGEVICDLLPAKNEQDVAGLYDLVSGTFYTATGGTLLEGNEVDDYELRVVGTPEVLSVGGANLLNAAAIDRSSNSYINRSTGKLVSNENFLHTDFISVTGGVAYYFGIQSYSASTAGLAWYSDADDEAYISGVAGTALANNDMVATAPEDARYVRFSIRVADDPNWDTTNYFCVNGALDAYQPYTAPQTASVQNLYQVGDYKDEQDIISGAVTRRVGVKVLDGTENWGAKNATSGQTITRVNDMLNQSSAPLIVTHGEWSTSAAKDSNKWRVVVGPYLAAFPSQETTADFKAWLADQHASGTPVIVLYPLAEETTETVTRQSLRTESGSNTVSAVAEVTVPLKVEYKDEG